MNILCLDGNNLGWNAGNATLMHSSKELHNGKTYAKLTYDVKIDAITRLFKIVQVVALSILTCFIALAFESVRTKWSEGINGIEHFIVYDPRHENYQCEVPNERNILNELPLEIQKIIHNKIGLSCLPLMLTSTTNKKIVEDDPNLNKRVIAHKVLQRIKPILKEIIETKPGNDHYYAPVIKTSYIEGLAYLFPKDAVEMTKSFMESWDRNNGMSEFAAIAKGLAKTNRQEAAHIAQKALNKLYSERVYPNYFNRNYKTIIKTLTHIDPVSAEVVANKVLIEIGLFSDVYKKVEALTSLCKIVAVSNPQKALEIAEEALVAARSIANDGEFELKDVSIAAHGFVKAYQLALISQALAVSHPEKALELVEEALELITPLPEIDYTKCPGAGSIEAMALGAISKALTLCLRKEQALEIAEEAIKIANKIRSNEAKTIALCLISESMALLNANRGYEIAQKISSALGYVSFNNNMDYLPFFKSLLRVIKLLDPAKAAVIAENAIRIQNTLWYRGGEFFRDIVTVLGVQNPEKAVALAETIKDNNVQTEILAKIALKAIGA